MAKSDRITKQDSYLFRESVGPVNRIEHDGHVFRKPKPHAFPYQSRTGNRLMMEETTQSPRIIDDIESEDELLFKRPGIQHQIFRKLRRGQLSVAQELDLHGMTVRAAKPAILSFLANCYIENKRCVRIIHGKGYGSNNRQPVLKNKLNQWLRQHNDVLAFCSARQSDGGAGAIYVLIKQSNKY